MIIVIPQGYEQSFKHILPLLSCRRDIVWHSLYAKLSEAFAKMPGQPQQPLKTSRKMGYSPCQQSLATPSDDGHCKGHGGQRNGSMLCSGHGPESRQRPARRPLTLWQSGLCPGQGDTGSIRLSAGHASTRVSQQLQFHQHPQSLHPTVIGQLVHHVDIEHCGCRNMWRMTARIAGKLLAYNLGVFLNSQAGRPAIQFENLVTA